jgi:antitoxin HicB
MIYWHQLRGKEKAEFNAAEVLTLILEYLLAVGENIPVLSSLTTETRMITPELSVQSAILLRQARGERSLSKLALTRSIVI